MLALLTWNTQLMPGPFPGQAGSSRFVSRRAEAIAERVATLAASATLDVVAFQEVWRARDAERLGVALAASGFPHAHVPEPKCGLALFSAARFPIVRADFRPFAHRAGPEGRFLEKGAQVVLLEDAEADEAYDAKYVAVANAHLQSDFWGDCSKTRARQIPVVRDALEEAVAWASAREKPSGGGAGRGEGAAGPSTLAVAVGDFNVAAASREYHNAMRLMAGGGGRGGGARTRACKKDQRTPAPGFVDVAPRDKRGRLDAATFPTGRYRGRMRRRVGGGVEEGVGRGNFGGCFGGCFGFGSRGEGYAAATPRTRLDYVLRRVAPDETAEDASGRSRAVALAEGLGRTDDGEPLSDHAPVFAQLARR